MRRRRAGKLVGKLRIEGAYSLPEGRGGVRSEQAPRACSAHAPRFEGAPFARGPISARITIRFEHLRLAESGSLCGISDA